MYAMSSIKLLNWKFKYWHFDKYFILYTSIGVMNFFTLINIFQEA